MSSTFTGLEIGKRSLFAQQAALNTTSHNIANANTQGYTRQRAEMQATPAIPYPGMNNDVSPAQLGTGVEVNKLTRLREDYLDVQYRGNNKDLGYHTATSDTYTKIEGVLNEPSDNGLANTMDQFYQSFQELSKSPDSAATRAVVRQNGVAVTQTFQYINDSLNQMTSDLNNVISVKVGDINSIAKQIGDLNNEIAKVVPNNYQPNDLYDQRDNLLDQLSNLVNVDVKQSSNGMVDVMVSGQALVSGQTANTLSVSDDHQTVTIKAGQPASSTDQGTPVTLQSGELLGRMDAVTKIIPGIQQSIKDLATGFVNTVNSIHQTGTDLDGNTGGPFFTTPDDQGNFSVSSDIMSSLNKIAAAKSSSVGDGSNAQAIADMQTNNMANSNFTADDFYRNVIGQLGVDSQQAQRMQTNTQAIVSQVDNQRQSVSGVSLDEEMSNMIRYQQAYNAAARVVTTMDQVLDKVINGMGAGL